MRMLRMLAVAGFALCTASVSQAQELAELPSPSTSPSLEDLLAEGGRVFLLAEELEKNGTKKAEDVHRQISKSCKKSRSVNRGCGIGIWILERARSQDALLTTVALVDDMVSGSLHSTRNFNAESSAIKQYDSRAFLEAIYKNRMEKVSVKDFIVPRDAEGEHEGRPIDGKYVFVGFLGFDENMKLPADKRLPKELFQKSTYLMEKGSTRPRTSKAAG